MIFRSGHAKKNEVNRNKTIRMRATDEEITRIKRFAKYLNTDVSTAMRISLQIAMHQTGYVQDSYEEM